MSYRTGAVCFKRSCAQEHSHRRLTSRPSRITSDETLNREIHHGAIDFCSRLNRERENPVTALLNGQVGPPQILVSRPSQSAEPEIYLATFDD